MRVAAVVMLAACSGPSAATDAAPAVDYALTVSLGNERATVPLPYIDGNQTSGLHELRRAGEVVSHTVELRYLDHVLVRYIERDTLAPCETQPGVLRTYSTSLLGYDSGDVRYYADSRTSDRGACVGDGSAAPNCNCDASERCVPRVTLDSPRFTRLACAPAGAKQRGDACSFTADPDGAYDDCGSGLFCYQGTCHVFCPSGGAALSDDYPPDAQDCG